MPHVNFDSQNHVVTRDHASFFGAKDASAERVIDESWRMPRGNANASGASPNTLSSPLAVAWEFRADEAIETTPIVEGDLVFVSDVMGTLYAVSRFSGKEAGARNTIQVSSFHQPSKISSLSWGHRR